MHLPKDLVAASATPLVLGILADTESYGCADTQAFVRHVSPANQATPR